MSGLYSPASLGEGKDREVTASLRVEGASAETNCLCFSTAPKNMASSAPQGGRGVRCTLTSLADLCVLCIFVLSSQGAALKGGRRVYESRLVSIPVELVFEMVFLRRSRLLLEGG